VGVTPSSQLRSRRVHYGHPEVVPMLEELLVDAQSALLVSVAIVTLFGACEFLHRKMSVRVELTRKLSHVGAGVIVMSFPWVITSAWTVAALSVSFGGLLYAGKVTGMLSSVHSVERKTSGAYYYPVAVLGTFWLAEGDPLLFCVPIAVMALADTAAALVGQRLGINSYKVYDNERTLEGSLGFFILALPVIILGLALNGAPGWPVMLAVAVIAAIMATATESISVRGADNLFIPYTCFLVLDRAMRLGVEDLTGWAEGMLIGLALVAVSYRPAALTPTGGITVFLVTTLAWALGGAIWLLPMLTFFLLYIATAPRMGRIRTDLDEVFPTAAGSMIVVLAFGHSGDPGLFVPYLATLTASGAIALGRMAQRRSWPTIPLALSGALTPLIPMMAYKYEIPIVALGVATAAGYATFLSLASSQFTGRRMVASLVAGAVAWVAV